MQAKWKSAVSEQPLGVGHVHSREWISLCFRFLLCSLSYLITCHPRHLTILVRFCIATHLICWLLMASGFFVWLLCTHVMHTSHLFICRSHFILHVLPLSFAFCESLGWSYWLYKNWSNMECYWCQISEILNFTATRDA